MIPLRDVSRRPVQFPIGGVLFGLLTARLMATHRDLCAYALSLIANVYTLARPFVDGGMSASIPSQAVRERTLTVYTGVQQVTQALQITTTATITVLLVDRLGRMLWRGQGGYDEAQAVALERAIGGAA